MQDNIVDITSGNILIVDDEMSNISLIQQMLRVGDYQNIFETANPTKTVELCQRHEIDLILLDLNMPVMDGYEVMDQLRTVHLPRQPVILVLTAQHLPEFRQKAFDKGARDYVTKPCDMQELLSRVRNLLEMKLLQDSMQSQNHLLEEKIRERTLDLVKAQRHLHDTRLQVIRRLGRAAEFRDNETGFHIIRMSRVAELLARAVGMNANECDLILNASPMHDLGKIGIPDNILLKPGKLNPVEWSVMQTHAQIGADILSGDDSDLLTMAREIAITHHEKWNGFGYPNGLVGEKIPLSGRIAALADVFDALVSERPYKKAWPIEKALAYVKQERGEHFDPYLVDLFLANLDEVLSIHRQYETVNFEHAETAVNH